jgi:hypothetical protein
MAAVSLPLAAIALLAVGGEGTAPNPGGRGSQIAAPARPTSPVPPAAKAAAPAGRRTADNGPCFVCHANYEEEPLAVCHAKQGTGCMDCHGPSLAHRNDEGNVTPPDIIYPAARIDAACKKCHEEHNAPAARVIARWQERCPAKTKPAQIVCTDCHGEHRLKLRTVRWDKESRKLLDQPDAAGK